MPIRRTNNQDIKISLVVPIKDESQTLEVLINSIKQQSFSPAEIVFVDGGSTDNTRELAKELFAGDDRFKLVCVPEATPGIGRNIGVENSSFDWIAFTDAGIRLNETWLEKLVEKITENPEIDFIYGNYSPDIDNFFVKCAIYSYVPPQNKTGIRGKFIASSLMKKAVWEKVGGFPDFRAAEDLIFMEEVEKHRHKTARAPDAMVHWKVQPTILTTFRKFVLYSKHNVYAGRQWDWQYGVARQYAFLLIVIILPGIFFNWWLLGIPVWLFGRTARRIFAFRHEFGLLSLFNPVTLIGITFVGLVIDVATFVGWAQTFFHKKN